MTGVKVEVKRFQNDMAGGLGNSQERNWVSRTRADNSLVFGLLQFLHFIVTKSCIY
jgi:hypothetical protein